MISGHAAQVPLAETKTLVFERQTSAERAAVIEHLGLADAPRQPRFDEIARLAAEATGAAFALITIIDEKRQFFVSSFGIPVDLRELPIETSFCRWPIESGQSVAIFDAENNTLVAHTGAWRSGYRSYLGTPVFAANGVSIASLCVADREAREWTSRELATLEGLSRLLSREFEYQELAQDLAEDVQQRSQAQDALAIRNRQLDLLSRAAERLLLWDMEDDALLDTVLEDICTTFGMDAAYCYQLSAESRDLELTAQFGLGRRVRSLYARQPLGELLCGKIAETRSRLIIEDLQSRDHPGDHVLRERGVQCFAGFPLFAGEELVGTLALVTASRTHLAEGEVQTLAAICNQIGTCLERARLRRQGRDQLEQLRESEARFRRVFDNAAVSLWKADFSRVLDRFDNLRKAGVEDLGVELEDQPALLDELLGLVEVIDVNPETLQLFGAADKAELERLRPGLRTAQSRDVFVGQLLTLWRGETAYRSECRMLTVSGEPIDLMLSIRFAGNRSERALISLMDIGEIKRSEARLRASHATFRKLVENSPFGVYVIDHDFRIAMVSQGAHKVFENIDPLIGRSFSEVMYFLWERPFAEEAIAHFRHTLDTGEPYRSTHMVEQRVDIEETEAYDWQIERIVMPDGNFGVVCYFYDLSERQRHEEQVRTLMREVNHRSKNMLALVHAVAVQTASRSADEFLPRFIERIRGLSAAQDLLVSGEWRNIDLEALIRSQLAHFQDALDSGRISVSGPRIALGASAAQSLGMAFHELATNAGKYGSLSGRAGHVRIEWEFENGHLVLGWRESDGPPVFRPSREGFGTRMIRDVLVRSHGCEVAVDHAPSGLAWTARFPLARLVDADVERGWNGVESSAEHSPSRAASRILLVEDEALVAMEIADTLVDAGFEVVGPASSLAEAHALIDRERCDAAILDVNLGQGESSASLAVRLAAAGVPCLFLTGYSADQLPDPFSEGEVVSKPVFSPDLATRLERLLAR